MRLDWTIFGVYVPLLHYMHCIASYLTLFRVDYVSRNFTSLSC